MAEVNFHEVRGILSVSWSLCFSLCGHFAARSQQAPRGGILTLQRPHLLSNGRLHGAQSLTPGGVCNEGTPCLPAEWDASLLCFQSRANFPGCLARAPSQEDRSLLSGTATEHWAGACGVQQPRAQGT